MDYLLLLPLVLTVNHTFFLIAVDLKPEKPVIRADGRSTSVIAARVFDDRGAPVADGTRVQFSTTLGRLDTQVAETRGGFARVTLTAADQPGTATITANLEAGGAVPARAQVAFSNDTQSAELTNQWLRFTGSVYVSLAVLSPTLRIVDVLGKTHDARASYGDVTISADHIQYRLGVPVVYAEGNVVLEVGKVRRRYYRIAFDLLQQTGFAETATGRIELGRGLLETALPPTEAPSWQFMDLGAAPLVIGARSIGLNQEGMVQFRQATFYLEGQKAYSTPYHIMTLRQQSLYREQLVGVGASGMWLNLPYYFNVQPRGVGTLFLRRGAPFGSSVYSQRQGWTLDMEQSYNGAGAMEGQLQVLNLASTNRGLRLQHNQKLDTKTDASLFMDLIGGQNLFGSSQIGHNFPAFRVNMSAALNRYRGFTDTTTGLGVPASGDWRVQTTAESYPRLLGPKSGVHYALTAAHTDQQFFGGQNARGAIQSQNLGTRFYANPLKLDPRTSLTQSGVLGYTWVEAPVGTSGIGKSGVSVQTTTTVAQPVRWRALALGTFQVSYDYFQTPPLFVATGIPAGTVPGTPPTVPTVIRQGRQRLSATTFLNQGDRWNLSLSGSRGLDAFQSTLYTEVRTLLKGPWYARARLTDTQFSTVGYTDLEYALIRMVNGREVALYYSTTARRFQLDLTGLSF
ncbi:invasin domain 3-containing protein [Armatimonas sp.]|uniref:invasin domain 3-containing protein n=1 Tax=Armatimonas sp. TaxID=1872638 RepID=UPI00374D1E2C